MTDFYEDDEPLDELLAAFERGEKGVTRRIVAPVGWRCPHLTLTFGRQAIGPPATWCGCRMSPIFPDQLTSA